MKEMIEILMAEEMKDIESQPLVDAIEAMASKDYWETKNIRLSNLLVSEEIARIVIRETIGFSFTIQEIVAILAPKLSRNISYEDKIRNASDVIEACNNLIYKIDSKLNVISLYRLEPPTYEAIKAFKEYRPPLLCKPREWKSNIGGGYYLDEDHCILGSQYNKHSEPQALDVLNKLQNVELTLDPVVLEIEEMPNKEFKSPDSKKQFRNMADKSKELYKAYQRVFWFQWRFDKRGRMYSSGYLINIQASCHKKSLINFVNKELIRDSL